MNLVIKPNNRQLSIAVYVLFAIFMVIVGLNAYWALTAGKSMVYKLSLLPREQAYQIVCDELNSLRLGGIYGSELSQERIDAIFSSYMAKAEVLTWYEIIILEQKDNLDYFGRIYCSVVLPVLIANYILMGVLPLRRSR